MGIDKHLILTLKRSKNRHYAVRGGALAMQTPKDKIHFVAGHDNLDYDNDMRKVADAAEADGFPYAQCFAKGYKDDILKQSASGTCQVWNFSRILRYIALGNETCLVTWDDRVTTLPFPFIERITKHLQNRDEEFYFWQLRIRIGDAYNLTPNNIRILKTYPRLIGDEKTQQAFNDLMLKDWEMFSDTLTKRWVSDYAEFINNHYMGLSMTSPPHKYVEKYLIKNRIGYDESMVISPQGAAWILLQAMDMEDLDPADDDPDAPNYMSAVQRRNTFDSWMFVDLEPHVHEAIADHKGIYCPREIGYKYIHDWMPMGSSVEWANEDHYDTATGISAEDIRTMSTDFNFLEIP